MKPSGIGGQAVMEGVMMKNQSEYAVAVRKTDNEIVVEKKKCKGLGDKYGFFRLPVIRGIVAFVESLSLGMTALTYSASFFEEEEDEQESSFEKALGKVFKDKAEDVAMGLIVVLSILLALSFFVLLPYFAASFLEDKIASRTVLAIIEGVIRLTIFVGYLLLISRMEDIKRVFMYHGAEHMAINCVENLLPLTVDNVRKQSREHKRCGTSFMLYVLIISIIFFVFIRVETAWMRFALRVVLIPIVAGVAYEFIRFAGRSNSKVIALLSRPGMWLQGLTTKEPDDSMIEVAIASVEAVFNWEQFIEENSPKQPKVKKRGKRTKASAAKAGVKPEGKAGAKAEGKSGIKEEGKAGAKPERKADAETEGKAGTKAESKTDTKPGNKIDAQAENKPERKADAKEEGKAGAKPGSKEAAKAEGKAGAKPGSKVSAKSESKADAKQESKVSAKSESKADAKSEGKTSEKEESKAGAKAKSKTDTKTGSKSSTKSGNKAGTKPESKSAANPETEPEAKSVKSATVKPAMKAARRKRMPMVERTYIQDYESPEQDDEEDEILSALDKYFDGKEED